MTWAALIPGIAGLLVAFAAYLRAHTANVKIDDHASDHVDPPPPPAVFSKPLNPPITPPPA